MCSKENSNESSLKRNSIWKKSENVFQINVYFWKKNIFNCVCHWDYFKNRFLKIPFGKISIKYEILKLMFM